MRVGFDKFYWDFTVTEILDAFQLVARIPSKFFLKKRSKKIKIVFAITTENEDDKNRVENDLISQFEKYLDDRGLLEIFNVAKLSKEKSAQIKTFEQSQEFLQNSGNHLIIYGSIARRNNVESGYILNLDATVLHDPLPNLISSEISKDFTEVFPKRVFFPEKIELLGFEITKEWLGIVTRYMVGVAAMFSGNIGFSFNLFSEIKKDLDNGRIKGEINDQFKTKIKFRLLENARAICNLLYNTYIKTDDIRAIQTAKPYLDLIEKDAPQDEQVITLGSMYYYLVKNDLTRSEEVLTRKIKHSKDPTWRLNLAFIKSMNGELDEAKKMYDKASKQKLASLSALAEIEIFISKEIQKNYTKIELLFSRGYINYKIKGDYQLAKDDFNEFINHEYSHKYPEIKRLLKVYLIEINKTYSWQKKKKYPAIISA